MEIKLIDQINWDFGRGPQIRVRSYYEDVDPFPCYYHSLDLVTEIAHKCQEVFPIDPLRGPKINVLAYETKQRVNGWCSVDFNYDAPRNEAGNYEWHITIALSGKRTPLHPSMTRFVTAHEYGHGVEDIISRGMKPEHDGGEYANFRKEYAEIRGMEYADEFYGARTWHKSVGEVFADDFRILLPKVELEHWPHPEIPRPEDVPQIVEWWKSNTELYGYKKS